MKIIQLSKKQQTIGIAGEDNAVTVQIDAHELAQTYGEGSATVLFRRADGTVYPIASTMEGYIVSAVLTATETAYSGRCAFELQWNVGDVLAKSITYPAQINVNIGEETEPPERPGETWVQHIEGLVDGIEDFVEASIPDGGTSGQVLTKKEDGSNDWADPQGGGGGDVQSVNGKTGVVELTAEDVGALSIDTPIPASTSELTNDSGFITEDDIPPIPSELSELTGDAEHRTVSDTEKAAWNAKQPAGDYALNSAVTAEAAARQSADGALQAQIDALVSKSDVVDVVADYAALQAYDASALLNNDVVKVLSDSTHGDGRSYYRWVITGDAGAWAYIGTESVGYTKSEADALLNAKQDAINDLTTIRSGASAGATAYQKPASGIPKTDLAQDVQTVIDDALTETDATLATSGKAADAKAVGDELTAHQTAISLKADASAMNAALAQKQDSYTSTTITIAAASWSNNSVTVNVSGVTATNLVQLSVPTKVDMDRYGQAGVFCSAQGNGTLTFTCAHTPTAAISINVVIWG